MILVNGLLACRIFDRVLLGKLESLLLFSPLDLGSSLVVIGEVAGLAHADGVVESIGVFALGGILLSTEFAVARRAHVLGVVLSVRVGALGDKHDGLASLLILVLFGGDWLDIGRFFLDWFKG